MTTLFPAGFPRTWGWQWRRAWSIRWPVSDLWTFPSPGSTPCPPSPTASQPRKSSLRQRPARCLKMASLIIWGVREMISSSQSHVQRQQVIHATWTELKPADQVPVQHFYFLVMIREWLVHTKIVERVGRLQAILDVRDHIRTPVLPGFP